MTTELYRPFPSLLEADTEIVILCMPFKGKHDNGREETQVFKQLAGETTSEAQVSPVMMSLKFTV